MLLAYPINPFQDVRGILDELRDKPSECDAARALAMSAAQAVREENADALVRLAIAYMLWRGVRPAPATVQTIHALMRTVPANKP